MGKNMPDELLQPPLQGDERMEALARIIARLSVLPVERPLVNLVDIVTPAALPVLGEQWHIMGDEGWNYAAAEADRRAIVKRAIELHRHKGTPWAVRTAIDTALGSVETTVEEWFRYDGAAGEPYRFRLLLTLLGGGIQGDAIAKARAIALSTKNVRSHLDGITVSTSQEHTLYCAVAACLGDAVKVWPAAIEDFDLEMAPRFASGAHLQSVVNLYPIEHEEEDESNV